LDEFIVVIEVLPTSSSSGTHLLQLLLLVVVVVVVVMAIHLRQVDMLLLLLLPLQRLHLLHCAIRHLHLAPRRTRCSRRMRSTSSATAGTRRSAPSSHVAASLPFLLEEFKLVHDTHWIWGRERQIEGVVRMGVAGVVVADIVVVVVDVGNGGVVVDVDIGVATTSGRRPNAFGGGCSRGTGCFSA
jgi:hypothetical protein